MTGLLGVAIIAGVATAYAMDTPIVTPDFEQLGVIVNAAKAYKQEMSIKIYGLNELIIAICRGDQEKIDKHSILMLQPVQGLYPIHWAVIAKQNDIYEMLAKDPHNIKLKTQDGLSVFNLQVKFDAWNKDQTAARELKYHN